MNTGMYRNKTNILMFVCITVFYKYMESHTGRNAVLNCQTIRMCELKYIWNIYLEGKQQIPVWQTLAWPVWDSNPRSIAREASTLTITSLIRCSNLVKVS